MGLQYPVHKSFTYTVLYFSSTHTYKELILQNTATHSIKVGRCKKIHLELFPVYILKINYLKLLNSITFLKTKIKKNEIKQVSPRLQSQGASPKTNRPNFSSKTISLHKLWMFFCSVFFLFCFPMELSSYYPRAIGQFQLFVILFVFHYYVFLLVCSNKTSKKGLQLHL